MSVSSSSLLSTLQGLTWSSICLAIVGAILPLIFIVWNSLRARIEARKPFAALPMPPNNHFLWGHFLFLFKLDFFSATRMAAETSNEHGLLGYWIFGLRSLWVTHWEDARSVLLATDFRSLILLAKYHLSMAFGPRNMLLLKGRAWKFHRTAIVKSLVRITSGTLQQQAIAQVVGNLVQSLLHKFKESLNTNAQSPTTPATSAEASDYLEMNIEPLMKMITMDVFGKTALSTDFQCCQHMAPSPLASAFDFLGSDMTRRIRAPLSIASYWYSLPTKMNRKHYACRTLLRTFLSDLIQKRRAENKASTSSSGRDLLSLLIQATDDAKGKGEEEEVLADQTLSDVLMSLVFAGYDTTSICLTYAFYLLASHPVQQDYCWHETQRLLVDSSLEKVGIDDLIYCKAVVLESLRLFPPAFLVNRTIEKDLPLRGGFVAPAGANAVVTIWTLQRLDHNFPCPNDFRPDRWVKRQHPSGIWVDRAATEEPDHDSNTIPAGNMNAILAFSAGSRSCPGQKFAMQEAILALAGLVKEFKFHPVPGYCLQPTRQGVVQGPKGGLPLRITRRSSASVE